MRFACRGVAWSAKLADGSVISAVFPLDDGAAFNVIFVKDHFSNRIGWTHKPGRVVGAIAPCLRWANFGFWRGDLLNLVRH